MAGGSESLESVGPFRSREVGSFHVFLISFV